MTAAKSGSYGKPKEVSLTNSSKVAELMGSPRVAGYPGMNGVLVEANEPILPHPNPRIRWAQQRGSRHVDESIPLCRWDTTRNEYMFEVIVK
jgi:hypothetical protein